MRKGKTYQKNNDGEQLELFSSAVQPVGGTMTSGTGIEVAAGDTMLSRLEEQRAQTNNILERIVDYGNMTRACEKVVSNKGGAGIDSMEVTQLPRWLAANLLDLQRTILNGRYEPSAVRKVEIPKPTGGTRTLGIPTVKDRLIQQAIQQQLSTYYDPHFSQSSFGFRPNRNAHQAILQASEYIRAGNEWVVDIDLEKFFDTINHDRLMQRLSKGVGDKRLLRIINAYLKAGIMDNGITEQRVAGTPQGSPLSPLLSNIVLDELDKELEHRKHNFCRYADDCNIYVKSRKAGERVMASIIDFIEKKLKLKVNRSKSGVRHCSDVKFLGYTLLPAGGIRIADQSMSRLKDTIRGITQRNRGVAFSQIIDELNTVIIGWSTYFRLANKWLGYVRDLDGWIRRKVRCYRLKQCGRKYTTYKLLRSLGIPEGTSWNVVMYSQGWWEMTKKQAVNKAMSIEWFAKQGLQSLTSRITV